MSNIEKMARELAEECRKAGLNFVIAVEEDDEINSLFTVRGDSDLKKLVECLDEM